MKPHILPLILCAFAPAMSASAVGLVTIEPVAPDDFSLTWNGEKLRPYQVEASQDLLSWMDIPTIQIGNDAPLGLLVDPGSPLPTPFFYRVREGAIRPGFDSHSLEHVENSDDIEVSELAEIGFDINFAGSLRDECYVNNNGNITFDLRFGSYEPESFQILTGLPLIAAFWGDVQTKGIPAGYTEPVHVTYGQGIVDGSPAFGVNWVDVGYFAYWDGRYDKLNSFQLVLIDRSATGANGDFDIEFNYNQIQWEAGEANGAPDGYGGDEPPVVGLTDGSDLILELAGSGESLAFLDTIVTYDPGTGDYTDTGAPNYPVVGTPGTGGLKYREHASSIPGRLVFKVRQGQNLDGFVEAKAEMTSYAWPKYFTVDGSTSIVPAGAQVTYRWSVESGSASIPDPKDQVTAMAIVNENSSATIKLTLEVDYDGGYAKVSDTILISNLP